MVEPKAHAQCVLPMCYGCASLCTDVCYGLSTQGLYLKIVVYNPLPRLRRYSWY